MATWLKRKLLRPSKAVRNALDSGICTACAQLNFKYIFDPQYDDGKIEWPPRVFYWSLEVVRLQDRCPFCCLLRQTLGLSHDVNSLSHGIVRGEIEIFANLDAPPRRVRRLWVSCYRTTDEEPLIVALRERSVESSFGYCIQNHAKRYDLNTDSSYSLNPVTYVPEDLGKARRINSDVADMGYVAQWLSMCEKNHGCLQENPCADLPYQFRVIDVSRQCIAKAPVNCRYVALSYVWGSISPICLSRPPDASHGFPQ